MTEVPQGGDAPRDDDSAEPIEPGPSPSAPRFDDDALAAAMAAEVAAYTSPISMPRSDSSATAGLDAAELFAGGSTLEAIERLERELRRLSGEPDSEQASESSVDAEAPADLAEMPADLAEVDAESAAEPASDGPPGLVVPVAYQRFAPAPPVVDPPAAAAPPFAPPLLVPLTQPEVAEVPDEGGPGESVEPSPTDPTSVDIANLPPPIGLQPASIPPYQPGAVLPLAVDADPGGPSNVPPTDFDDEDDDAIDEIDRVRPSGPIVVGAVAAGVAGAAGGATAAPATALPPSSPIPTARLASEEPALVDEPAQRHPVLEIESAGAEPTALDLRVGRASRLFWLWFAANSSVVSLAVGATLFQLGMSLRQAIVATLAGVAVSFLPLGLGTLAGKWSGQPTMIVSRATFGVVGNVVPAALAVLSRAFWGGALLWMLAVAVGRVLTDAGLDAGLGSGFWTVVALVIGFALATTVAFFGYGFILRIQLVSSIVSGALIVGMAILTASSIDLEAALTTGDGPWILVVSGAVIVFSFIGLAWVHSSADLARYQRPASYGGSSMLWATFGATLPAFLLIGWGALLAASDPVLAEGLATAPLGTMTALVPAWYLAPLLLAAALGLISGAVITIYSGGFAILALGVRSRREFTTLATAALVLIVGVLLVFLVPDARTALREVATTLAVPVAAWAGIFAAEMMIRTRRFHAPSLLARGGVYPDVRWVNLGALVAITTIGFGLTSATLPGLGWQGFIFPIFGLHPEDPLATSDIGVFVALLLGLLVPLVTAIPAIRRQEKEQHDRTEQSEHQELHQQ